MKQKTLVVAVATLCGLVLAGCNDSNSDDWMPIESKPTVTGNVLVLTDNNHLASFNMDKPDTLISSEKITGLKNNDSLIGIDYRPADGKLYAVGSLGTIYIIDPSTNRAELKSTLIADSADTTAPYTAISGNPALMSVDFNPAADRLRVIGNDGQNLRINVDTGATTTDGAINGADATITSAAYSNSFAGTATTRLFDLDVKADRLYLQSPPNDGTLAVSAPLGINAEGSSGFDIDSNNNQGYAILNVGSKQQFYKIDINKLAATDSANAAMLVGNLPSSLTSAAIRGLALKPASDAGVTIQGLSNSNQLISFKLTKPADVSTVAITGLTSGETIVGIDYRLRTDVADKSGVLYGLSSLGNLYTINASTGAASNRRALTAAADDSTLPFTGLNGNSFAVDFNPAADRLRVISQTGQNLRINVDTGATITDGNLNGLLNPQVAAAAYTNSYQGAVSSTALFDLDNTSNRLLQQIPPNDGNLVSIGALGITLGTNSGFDIAGGDNGLALATVADVSSNTSSLYRINLTTGAATPAIAVGGTANLQASKIGTNTTPALIDLAIWLK